MRRKLDKDELRVLPNWPEKVVGGKYVRLLENVLQQLRIEEGHRNRKLFLDDVFITYLLAFHNPTIRSLRTIEDFSQVIQAQQHLSVRKVCKSTLSDFHRLADPKQLEPIIEALRKELNRKAVSHRSNSQDLAELLKRTSLRTRPTIEVSARRKKSRQVIQPTTYAPRRSGQRLR